jgi:putative zinc finger/helix-turn-helix YgiT family protein
MAPLICPECKEEKLLEKTGVYETTYRDRDDESHPLNVQGLTWLVCSNCGEVVLDDRAMTAIDNARRAAMGLLSPDQIRTLRMELGKTQRAMSALLGIGEKTYCRWESGSYVQSEGFDRYLRLLVLDPTNANLLEHLASEKAGFPVGESLTQLEKTFVHLKNVLTVEHRARPFIDQLLHGSLQAA